MKLRRWIWQAIAIVCWIALGVIIATNSMAISPTFVYLLLGNLIIQNVSIIVQNLTMVELEKRLENG